MTQAYKKKLIEVAIPLEAINTASAREKSIRHGHPSTLHLWWARRPLAACRAVLFAQLVDDPSAHPEKFPTSDDQDAERKRLFAIIEELVRWENSTNEEVLEKARAEIRASCDGELPPVYDPFSGGGSIPLEAQRLGLPAYGSDLNPVAVMIGKAMIEIPPKFKDWEPIHPGSKDRMDYRNAQGLAEDVKYYGEWMRERVFERIGHLYPQVDLPKEHGGGQATVIAWIWARTVPSPDPAFADVQVPLISSFTLRNTVGSEVWLSPILDRSTKEYRFEIKNAGTSEFKKKYSLGTKTGRATFECILSRTPITAKYIDEIASQGGMGHRLIAVIAEGSKGKAYIAGDSVACCVQQEAVQKKLNCNDIIDALPTQRCRGTFASNAQGRRYGFEEFIDYFNPRQKIAMVSFASMIEELFDQINADIGSMHVESRSFDGQTQKNYAQSICLYLAFAVDRLADAGSSMATWAADGFIRFTFARQGIAMTWDYAECNPFSDSTGNFRGATAWVCNVIENFSPGSEGKIVQASAEMVSMPPNSVVSTDPPYYNNISYGDLSDYFYIWMRKSIGFLFEEHFKTLLVPKSEELIADRYRQGSEESAKEFFLSGMTQALSTIRKKITNSHPTTIYYAFKKSEVGREGMASSGWLTFLQAVLEAQNEIIRTWPVRTERPSRTVALGNNALARSIVLVCRKRDDGAESVTRAEFIRTLKRELPPAIAELQAANISPADMPQSAIGPGMSVFSRYEAVLEADDSSMSVKTALQLINRELDEFLNDVEGEFDSETRFLITWFELNGYVKGEYGTANSIAQARGISVESVKHAGIIDSAAGSVRVLKRTELPDDWLPEKDTHPTVWEACQYLIRVLETEGEDAAAILLKRFSAEQTEAVKDLTYCLYDICSNKRKDAKEATAYNGLIAVWSDLTRIAASISLSGNEQSELDL